MPEAVLRFPEGRFEGEVDDKQIPNGEGCLEFPGNDEKERQSYDGDFKDKKAHGKGLMRWRQGDAKVRGRPKKHELQNEQPFTWAHHACACHRHWLLRATV